MALRGADEKTKDYDAPQLKSFIDKVPSDDQAIIRATYSYREEAYMGRRDRIFQNRLNYDTYNLKGDFSHKKKGQSKEFLPRQALAVEQISSFFQQALIDSVDWFKVKQEAGKQGTKIKDFEIERLTQRFLEKAKFDEVVVDGMKMGLLGSLMVAKVHGEYVNRPVFYSKDEIVGDKVKKSLFREDKEVWRLKIDLIRQEDWFPDPTGDGMYVIQQSEVDLHTLRAWAEEPNSPYDKSIIDQIVGGFEDVEQVGRKARETGQNPTYTSYRKRVRLWECWGTIIDPASGETIAKDVTWTVANDRFLIAKPRPYPFWHGKKPFVVTPIIRTPKSVWHKALMDAPTAMNLALNESYNLLLDTGIMATFGIRQLRTSGLSDETKISDGIGPGETLEVNDSLPVGAKVMEPIQTVQMGPESINIFNLTNQEFNLSAITNDLRMGAVPARAVKATEVVEASNTITSMFNGLVKIVEQNWIQQIVEMAWATIAQHMDDIDEDEVKALLGEQRQVEIAQLSPEERFAETVEGFKFKVHGVSMLLNKTKDFKKLTSLLQTISSSPVLMEEFIKENSMGALLREIIESLDIDVSKIELDAVEREAMAGGAMGAGAAQPGTGPDMQSQIAQVSGMGDEGSAGGPQPAQGQGGVAQASFPPSRATR